MQKIFANSSYAARIIYLLLFSFVGSLMASVILMSIAGGVPSFESSTWYLRISILLQDALLLFFPAYTVCRWSTEHPMRMLGMRKSRKLPLGLFYALLIFLVSYPALSVISAWNGQISFPEPLRGIESWMRQVEDLAKQTTGLLLSESGVWSLFLNLAIVAGAAAFVEELFFRGALQQFIERWLGKKHAAVWLTALVFSAIHLQFYGFFPRLFMGAIIGYLFLYSRNIWIPILYHFVNNALIIVLTYFHLDSALQQTRDALPLNGLMWVILLVSAILTCWVFAKYRKLLTKNNDSD